MAFLSAGSILWHSKWLSMLMWGCASGMAGLSNKVHDWAWQSHNVLHSIAFQIKLFNHGQGQVGIFVLVAHNM